MTERTTDEAIAEIWKLFADTDARMKETDALLKETAASMKDTDARMKETDARIRRMEGAWGIQWGRMLEALVRPAATPGADRYAYHKGLFVLGLTGEGLVTIRNDMNFRPRDFGAGAARQAA